MYCAGVKAFVSQLLCVALCNRTRRENEGRKSGKNKKLIVLSGKFWSLHHRMVT